MNAEDVKTALMHWCRDQGVVIYKNDSTGLVTVTSEEGEELFSFSHADEGVVEP